jgi:hypothetical protein
MCPHTTIYVSSDAALAALAHEGATSEDTYIVYSGYILYMCPHTTIYVSSDAALAALAHEGATSEDTYILYSGYILYMCPHTTIYVSSDAALAALAHEGATPITRGSVCLIGGSSDVFVSLARHGEHRCCFTAALLLLYCCFTAALLLLYCCFTFRKHAMANTGLLFVHEALSY